MSTLYEAAQALKATLERGTADPMPEYVKTLEELGADAATIETFLQDDNPNKLTDYAFACLVTHIAADK